MKKIFALFLSIIFILSSSGTILAVENDTYTITIVNPSKHTYEAYQVFSGRLETTSRDSQNFVLSDIQWGAGVNSKELLDDLKVQETRFSKCKSAAEVSKVLSEENNNTQLIKKFAKIAGKHLTQKSGTFSMGGGNSTISGLSAGYYLVKDQEDSVQGYDAYTEFVLKVVANATVTPKSSVPSVSKKVQENSNSAWQKVADYAIGSSVPFQLIGTLSSHWKDYESYSYVFHDTLSKGFTFQSDTIKVFMKNGETKTVINPSNYTVTSTAVSDQCSFEVRFNNLKLIDGLENNSQIIVEYDATLNEQAIIAGDGNPNEVYLEFSNNPNGIQTGQTPKDQVVVYTYELVVNKTDEKKQELPGAAFSLFQMKNNKWESVKTIEAGDSTKFHFKGLDIGKYKLVETKAPAGYNKIEDIIFTIHADYNKEPLPSTLTNISIQDEQGTTISHENGMFQVNIKPTLNNHNIVTTIINKKGATLPETGGRGTQMIYVAGGILIAVSLIGFAVKRKQKNRKKED